METSFLATRTLKQSIDSLTKNREQRRASPFHLLPWTVAVSRTSGPKMWRAPFISCWLEDTGFQIPFSEQVIASDYVSVISSPRAGAAYSIAGTYVPVTSFDEQGMLRENSSSKKSPRPWARLPEFRVIVSSGANLKAS